MAFRDFPKQRQGVDLLQRSLERGRLAHAYLFAGDDLGMLEDLSRTLAKVLMCQQPVRKHGKPVDSCDQCPACLKTEHGNHPEIHWVRPESKSRVITIDQMRETMREIQLKPTESDYKVAIVVAAERLNEKAANAFLKTLEEPPQKSVLLLLTTEPQRMLETLVSRCLRLTFGGEGLVALSPSQRQWLMDFTEMAAAPQKSLLGRYRLMDILLQRLTEMRAAIEETLTQRSPLQQYKDAEKETIERWEDELAAAIEAEYRRQRSDLLGVLQWWFRDVWLLALKRTGPTDGQNAQTSELLNFPELSGTRQVAERISTGEALENLNVMELLQRWLGTNVQEALALEVGMLKLKF